MPNDDLIALHQALVDAEENLKRAQENFDLAVETVDRVKRTIERWEGVHPDKAPGRRHLRRIMGIPSAVGAGAAIAKELAGAHSKTIAAGGAVLIVGGTIGAYAVLHSPQQSRPNTAMPRPPAVAAPKATPSAKAPPRTGPAKPKRDPINAPGHPQSVDFTKAPRLPSAPALPVRPVGTAPKTPPQPKPTPPGDGGLPITVPSAPPVHRAGCRHLVRAVLCLLDGRWRPLG